MKNLKIKHKVILGIVIIVFINIIFGSMISTTERDTRSKNELVIKSLTDIHYLKDWNIYHSEWSNEIDDLLLYDRPFNGKLDYSRCEFNKWINDYIESEYFINASSDYKQIILEINKYHMELHKSAEEATSKYKEGKKVEARDIYDNDVKNDVEELSKSINQAETILHQLIKLQTDNINKISQRIDMLSLLVIIVSILSAAIVITILIRETIKPLSELIKKIKEMNENEIYQEIEDLHTSDEMRNLITVFNRMISKVNTQQIKLQDQNEELIAQGEELTAQNEELMAQGEELAAQNEEIIAHQQDMQETLSNLEEHERLLKRLYQFSKLLNQTINQEELIQHVLEGLQEEVNAQVGAFIIYNQEQNVLEVKYTSGLLNPEGLASFKLGEGLAGRAALQRKTLIASYNEGQLMSQGLHGKLSMSSEIYQPLIIQDRLLGVIALGRLGDSQISPSEQKLLASLADQISIALDNTSTHLQTQEALSKIQELDKLKSEMINTVSHELRTPLASILGFTELLLKKSPNEIKAKKYLSTVYSEANRLKLLINDFLDLQKIETGRFDFEKKHVNLTELLQKSIEVYKGQDNSNHLITLDIEENLPLILTDPDRLSQVVGNLLSNAIKYSPNGGEIELRAFRSGSDQLRVMVRDHGLGIPEDAQKNLFKPFYRVDNSDRREIGGTGLGLAICNKIIRALGGDIWVESLHGQGSTFNFTLPLVDDVFELMVDKVKKEKVNAGTKDLILIVEDDRSLSHLMSEELKEDGYKTVVLDNGPSTIAFLEENLPQAIVLDLILVGPLDGWEVLRRLKMNEKTKNIPVIISSSVDQKEQGKKFHVADYLVKPFPPEKLVSSIHAVTQTKDGYVGIPQLEQKQNIEVGIKQLLNDKGFAVTEIKKQKDVYVINIEPEALKEMEDGQL